jgi:hypothetical protein
MTAHDAHFWTAVEALIAAALAVDPERTRALVTRSAPTAAERAAENVRIIVAAVGKHPGSSARALRDHARTEAREAFGRGLVATEHEAAVRAALTDGLIAREGDRTRGYRFEAVSRHDTRPQADGAREAEAVIA